MFTTVTHPDTLEATYSDPRSYTAQDIITGPGTGEYIIQDRSHGASDLFMIHGTDGTSTTDLIMDFSM
jgi:hypothetical protein